jgi:murein L,D-transpeptidase YcbB/YkuD
MNAVFGHIYRYFLLLTLAGIPAFLSSCKTNLTRQTNNDTSAQEQFVSTADTCLRMPENAFADVYLNLNSPAVYDYYKSRGFALHWGDSAQASAMIEVIHTVRLYGLLSQDYHVAEVESIRSNPSCASRQRLDALLTDALFTISSHISKGRLRPFTVDSVLLEGRAALSTPSDIQHYLATREPRHEGYRMLRSALTAIYDTLPAKDRHQLLDGVTSDSISAQRLIKKIEVNLERWRWEDGLFEKDHVWINIPAFEVIVFRSGKEVLRSKAVVGAPGKPTPTFSSAIECFTVYPYWHVPRSIAVGEYLPSIKKNISFIPLNNLEVLDNRGNILRYDTLPWHTYNHNNFPISLRQREGTHNALGVVKFQFDNPYSVLLHDTNAKGLFRHENRARSHGCIRMEKAIEFAYYLADNYSRYTSEQVAGYLETKTMRRIDLDRQLPIHIRYFTVAYDGKALKEYGDVYGRDKQLLNQYYNTGPIVTEKKLGG